MTALASTSKDHSKSCRLKLLLLATGMLSLAIWFAAPTGPEADYAGTGLLLAPTNYALLIPLAGFGAALAGLEGLLFAEALSLFAAGLAVSAAVSDGLLLMHQDALSFIVRYPVTNCALAALSGFALFVAGRMKGIPIAAASLLLGSAFGVTIGLYSPGDDQALWFVVPAAMAGSVVVLAAALLLTTIEGPWWTIGRNILASWLIATSVLLAGFPLVPRRDASPDARDEASRPASEAGSEAIEKPVSQSPPPLGYDGSRQP